MRRPGILVVLIIAAISLAQSYTVKDTIVLTFSNGQGGAKAAAGGAAAKGPS